MMMVTAKMALEKMEESGSKPNSIIDKLLLDEIIPRFQQQQTRTIKLSATKLWNYVDRIHKTGSPVATVSLKELIAQLQLRGFVAEYKLGHSQCCFEITIPPGDE